MEEEKETLEEMLQKAANELRLDMDEAVQDGCRFWAVPDVGIFFCKEEELEARIAAKKK
jgi:hypothetical protein